MLEIILNLLFFIFVIGVVLFGVLILGRILWRL